jgi:hypothetical protein
MEFSSLRSSVLKVGHGRGFVVEIPCTVNREAKTAFLVVRHQLPAKDYLRRDMCCL